MAEEPSLSYYLPIAGGRIIGFIPFPRVLVLCEMQSVSSRIWTRIAVFISYGDNDYTTGTSTDGKAVSRDKQAFLRKKKDLSSSLTDILSVIIVSGVHCSLLSQNDSNQLQGKFKIWRKISIKNNLQLVKQPISDNQLVKRLVSDNQSVERLVSDNQSVKRLVSDKQSVKRLVSDKQAAR